MPGDFTTAAQPARASRPPASVASTGPSTSRTPPGGGGRSSTGTAVARSVASLARVARPSTPRPHTPTRAPARSDQQIFGRVRIGDVVRSERPPQAGDLGVGGGQGQVTEALVERPQHGRPGPVRAPGGQHDRGPALADVADALPRLGV